MGSISHSSIRARVVAAPGAFRRGGAKMMGASATAQLIKFDCFREIKIPTNPITTGPTDRMQCNEYPEAGGLKLIAIYLARR